MNNKLTSDVAFVRYFCICTGVERCTKHLQKQSSSLTGDRLSEEGIGKTVRGCCNLLCTSASALDVLTYGAKRRQFRVLMHQRRDKSRLLTTKYLIFKNEVSAEDGRMATWSTRDSVHRIQFLRPFQILPGPIYEIRAKTGRYRITGSSYLILATREFYVRVRMSPLPNCRQSIRDSVSKTILETVCNRGNP